MPEPRKLVLDRFQEHMYRNFDAYCKRHRIKRTDDALVTFLIDQELIPATHMTRYAVLHEFGMLLKEEKCHKTLIVNALANKFNLSERTVWNILKHAGPEGAKAPRTP